MDGEWPVEEWPVLVPALFCLSSALAFPIAALLAWLDRAISAEKPYDYSAIERIEEDILTSINHQGPTKPKRPVFSWWPRLAAVLCLVGLLHPLVQIASLQDVRALWPDAAVWAYCLLLCLWQMATPSLHRYKRIQVHLFLIYSLLASFYIVLPHFVAGKRLRPVRLVASICVWTIVAVLDRQAYIQAPAQAVHLAPDSPASSASSSTLLDGRPGTLKYADCLLSQFFFGNVDGFLFRSLREPIAFHSMPALPEELRPAIALAAFRKVRRRFRHRSLLFQMAFHFRRPFLIQSALRVIKCIFSLLLSLTVRNLLQYLSDKEASKDKAQGYVLAALFGGCLIARDFVGRQSDRSQLRIVGFQSILMLEIMAKTSRMKATEEEKNAAEDDLPISTGSLQNILTDDIQLVYALFTESCFMLIDFPILFSVPLVLLWKMVGSAALAALAVVALMFLAKGVATYFVVHWFQSKKTLMDSRVKMAHELFGHSKFIKFFSLSQRFAELLDSERAKEVQEVRKIRQFQTGEWVILWRCKMLVATAVLVTHFWITGSEISATLAFTVFTICTVLCDPCNYVSYLFANLGLAIVALRRIESALNAQETTKYDSEQPDASSAGFRDVTASWADFKEDLFALRGINLDLSPGLHVVTGQVGDGKSSLLMALLHEMLVSRGIVFAPSAPTQRLHLTNRRTAYCAQSAFLISGTCRENILWGSDYDELRYRNVIKACALEADFSIMQFGDMTEVGQNGQRTSGGQRQRICLARAVYSRASILLLDDVLSAVDSGSARTICDGLFGSSLLRSRTIVLVSYYAPVLKYATNVICLRAGQITSVSQASKATLAGSPLKEAFPADEDAAAQETTKKDELYSDEVRGTGIVSSRVYGFVARAFGGNFKVAFCVLLFVLSQVADTGNLLIIRQMTSDTNAFPLLFLMKAYAASTALSFLLDFWRIWAVIVGGVDASQKIYNQHFRALNSSTLSWLEGIPISRILQRSSTDQNTLDTALYSRIMFFVTDWVYALSTGIVLIYLMPFFALPALFYTCAAMFLVRAYSQVVQDLKRLEGASRSPLVTYVAEVFAGRITFRAFGTLDLMLESASTLVEDFVRPQYNLRVMAIWLSLRLSLLNALGTIVVVLFCIYSDLGAATTGFALTALLEFFVRIFWGGIHLSELHVEMTAAERIMEYVEEAEQEPTGGLLPPASWPSRDSLIRVESLSMRYRPELPLVLKDVTFEIRPRERVAIVGRTGSGKSTLSQAFFRFLEANSGGIVIDDIDIASLNLGALRQKLTIIPQDATLFENTLRFNLDPFDTASDAELWQALQAVDLAGKPSSRIKSLDVKVLEGGSNFSSGEKQLIALARGLIRLPSSALVILDEASASLDHDTDHIIQKTIRKEITGSLLCIAHRLNTVADFDRILCLDRGSVVAFDTPYNLLNDSDSLFHYLAQESGEYDKLYAIARDAHASH